MSDGRMVETNDARFDANLGLKHADTVKRFIEIDVSDRNIILDDLINMDPLRVSEEPGLDSNEYQDVSKLCQERIDIPEESLGSGGELNFDNVTYFLSLRRSDQIMD